MAQRDGQRAWITSLINQQDIDTFAVTFERTQASGAIWRLVELRHTNTHGEFGGDHHIYVEALDINGNKMRGIAVYFEVGDMVKKVVLDKGLNEPGTNWPLFRGNYVNVRMEGQSDRVFNLNGEYGPYKGSDLYHHSWLVTFQRAMANMQTEKLFIPYVTNAPTVQPAI